MVGLRVGRGRAADAVRASCVRHLKLWVQSRCLPVRATELNRSINRLAGYIRFQARLCLGLICFLSGGQHLGAADENPKAEGWSQDLLARLISAPLPQTSGKPDEASEGMVLRSYQLRSLRLGDPGRATNLVNILQRMLPLDSRVTEDRPANTLHVLSSVTAQQAALELISAMDSEGVPTASHPEAITVPEDVRKALESLAASRPDSDQLLKIVEESSRRTEDRLSEVVRQSQEDSRAHLQRVLTVGGGTVVVLALLLFVGFSFVIRRTQKRDFSKAVATESAALALLPTQSMEAMMSVSRDQQERTKELQKLMESFSIAYQADRQRNTILMEAVAKKHGELAATLTQMEQVSRDLGSNAGNVFLEVNRQAIDQIISQASEALQTRAAEVGLIAETASRKMEETANRLDVQNTRAAALAAELERTQKEVDALFEKLKTAQEQAQQAQREANEQRQIAYEKTAELTKKEAALAGLSLLMQEPVSDILDTLGGVDTESSPQFEPPTKHPEFHIEPPDDDPGSAPSLGLADAQIQTSPLLDTPPCPTPRFTYRISPAA